MSGAQIRRELAVVRGGAVDLNQQPTAVALLAHHAHTIRMHIPAAARRRALTSIRREHPAGATGDRDGRHCAYCPTGWPRRRAARCELQPADLT